MSRQIAQNAEHEKELTVNHIDPRLTAILMERRLDERARVRPSANPNGANADWASWLVTQWKRIATETPRVSPPVATKPVLD